MQLHQTTPHSSRTPCLVLPAGVPPIPDPDVHPSPTPGAGQPFTLRCRSQPCRSRAAFRCLFPNVGSRHTPSHGAYHQQRAGLIMLSDAACVHNACCPGWTRHFRSFCVYTYALYILMQSLFIYHHGQLVDRPHLCTT